MVVEHSHLTFYMLLTAYKPARIYMYFRFFLANKLREEASTNPRGQPHNIFVYGNRISKGEAPPGPPEINAVKSDEIIAYNLRKTHGKK